MKHLSDSQCMSWDLLRQTTIIHSQELISEGLQRSNRAVGAKGGQKQKIPEMAASKILSGCDSDWIQHLIPFLSPLCCTLCPPSVDDEHLWHDDGHAGGAAQESQHQNMAGPHCSVGSYFQHR